MKSPEVFLSHLEPIQEVCAAYARRMLRVPDSLEDVLQSTLRTAYAKFNLYAEGTNFRAWFFRILTLEIFNANRKFERVRHMEISLDALNELDAMDGNLAATLDRETDCDRLLENLDRVFEHLSAPLAAALHTLPPMERGVLLQRAIGGFQYKEVAAIMEIPVGSVLGYLSRARARLRFALAGYASRQGLLGRHEGRGRTP